MRSAVEELMKNQRQLDPDGIEVAVSREALEQVLQLVKVIDLFGDVGNFHKKFGLPFHGEMQEGDDWNQVAPHLLDLSDNEFREKFMQEELDEYKLAVREGDLPKAADALCDLTYVALGTAHLMHVPFLRCWFEVQRANMAKERATSAEDDRSKRKHSLDVVKPAGWTPPDIEGALKEYDR